MRHMTPLGEMPGLATRWCGMMGLDIVANFEPSGDDRLFPNRLCLSGPDAPLLLSGRPQVLDALQHLLHEAQGERDDSRLVYLDVNGTRLFRMKELLAMAQIAAAKARQTGSFVFGSLTPKERKWVHIALGDEPDLNTHSEGLGAIKKLTVARKAQ